MGRWNLVPFGLNRPDIPADFTEADRERLELQVANTASQLLGNFGEIDIVPVAVSTVDDTDEVIEFHTLSLPYVNLEDDWSISLTMLPKVNGQTILEPGTYCVEIGDQDEEVQYGIAIVDPTIETKQRVTHNDGTSVKFDELLELLDAFRVIHDHTLVPHVKPHNDPIDASMFPVPIVPIEFEALFPELDF